MKYFVKNNGGTGTGVDDANAWSLAKYNSMAYKLASNDVVSFRCGDRFLGSPIIKVGAESKITLNSYGTGPQPVFDGFTTLTTWTLLKGNIYYAALNTTNLNGVTLDGVIKSMGRYPNTGYLTYTGSTGNTAISGESIGTLPASFVGGEVVIKKARYIIDRHKITAQKNNTITYTSPNLNGSSSFYAPNNGNGFFVQNHLATLDQEGDWYFDEAAKRLYMHFGVGTPAGRTIKANTSGDMVHLEGASFVTLQNLDFEGGRNGIGSYSSNNINIVDCNFRQQANAIFANYTSKVNITGGSISDCYNAGILGDDNNNFFKISGVTITGTALIPGLGSSGDLTYNAIAITGSDNTISNCKIINTGYNGIYFDGSNILVENNYVDTHGLVKDDSGGLYTYTNAGVKRTNRIIRNNLVLNGIGCPEGALFDGDNFGKAAAIYLDGASNDTEVSGNVCANGTWAGMLLNANRDNKILNNTFFNFETSFAINSTAITGDGAVRNNIVTGNKFIARTSEQKTMQISLFVDDNPALFGTFDKNIYSRPVSEGAAIDVHKWFNGQNNPKFMSLAEWKTSFNQDVNSTNSGLKVSNPADLRFEYNNSPTSKTVDLKAVYKTVTNEQVSAVTIPPFGGVLMTYAADMPSTPSPVPTPVPVPEKPTIIEGTISINGKQYKLVPVQ